MKLGPLAGLAMVALSAHSSSAQSFQPRSGTTDPPCVLDRCLNGSGSTAPSSVTRPSPGGVVASGGFAPGQFDFYVLALSWSPGFCDTGGAGKAGAQCADGADLGFVVHGLWPQFTHGFPSDCDATARALPRSALDSVEGLYPDVGLARYEWRKHGTCTGLNPTAYFAAVRTARQAVTIPDSLRDPHEPETLAPLDIARAFTQANAGLRTDMMAVTCRQDELAEVRICFAKDLRSFTTCPEVARGACRTRAVTVLPAK